MPVSPISHNAVVLASFAAICTVLVVSVHILTKDRIQQSKDEAMMQSFYEIVPANRFDNNIAQDCITRTDADALGVNRPVRIFRMRKNNEPSAVVIEAVAPDGYSGEIAMMVGIYVDGNLSGVRVIEHHETPGLGDKIELAKNPWIKQFKGLSLEKPAADKWAVKKDGGEFDAFTGATITPRAVVKAIKNAQDYFAAHKEDLFAEKTSCPVVKE